MEVKLRNVLKGRVVIIKTYPLIYFIIISTFFTWMSNKARARALCESDIIPIFAKQRLFVYADKATYTFVGSVAIESPGDKSHRVFRPRNFVPRA